MPYFDHNATAPLHPIAREAWVQAYEHTWQNPGGPYRSGARVHARLEDARERLAEVLNARPEQIVFTSGATESNNAVIASAAAAGTQDAVIAVSPTEHPSVIEAARHSWGARIVWLRVDRSGRVDEAHLCDLLKNRRPSLVCIMGANNETGVVASIERLASLCREARARLLCDATQWFGKLPTGPLNGADYLTGSGHKFGAPKGVGFVRVPADATADAWMRGGHQENGHRAGTENTPSVEAMVAVLTDSARRPSQDLRDRIEMRQRFEAELMKGIPGSRVLGVEAERLWNTVSVVMPVGENMRWVGKLDHLGYEVSTGSACASGSGAPSHVLAAMEVSAQEARRTIRISSGWDTTADEWKGLLEAMVDVSVEQAATQVIRVVSPYN